MKKFKGFKWINVFVTLAVLRTILPMFSNFAHFNQLLIVKIANGLISLSLIVSVFFLVKDSIKNKNHFLYNQDRKKFIINWLVLLSAIITVIVLVAVFFKPF